MPVIAGEAPDWRPLLLLDVAAWLREAPDRIRAAGRPRASNPARPPALSTTVTQYNSWYRRPRLASCYVTIDRLSDRSVKEALHRCVLRFICGCI